MTNTQSKYHEDNDEFYLLFLIYIKWKNPKNPEYIHSRYKKSTTGSLTKFKKESDVALFLGQLLQTQR